MQAFQNQMKKETNACKIRMRIEMIEVKVRAMHGCSV